VEWNCQWNITFSDVQEVVNQQWETQLVLFLPVLYSPFLLYSLSLPIRPTKLACGRASQESGNVVPIHLDKIKDRTEQQAVLSFYLPRLRHLSTKSCLEKTVGFNYTEEVVVICCHWWDPSLRSLRPFVSPRVCLAETLSLFQVAVSWLCLADNGLCFVHDCNLQQNNSPECWAPFRPSLSCCQHLLASPTWDATSKCLLNICYSSHPLAIIQPCLKKLLSSNATSKCIIYSNCHVNKIEGIHLKLSFWLDTNDLHSVDTTLTPGQNAHHIKAFVNSVVDSEFHPRVLSMTSSATNAGINLALVFGIF
jgi:hypothetical protein